MNLNKQDQAFNTTSDNRLTPQRINSPSPRAHTNPSSCENTNLTKKAWQVMNLTNEDLTQSQLTITRHKESIMDSLLENSQIGLSKKNTPSSSRKSQIVYPKSKSAKLISEFLVSEKIDKGIFSSEKIKGISKKIFEYFYLPENGIIEGDSLYKLKDLVKDIFVGFGISGEGKVAMDFWDGVFAKGFLTILDLQEMLTIRLSAPPSELGSSGVPERFQAMKQSDSPAYSKEQNIFKNCSESAVNSYKTKYSHFTGFLDQSPYSNRAFAQQPQEEQPYVLVNRASHGEAEHLMAKHRTEVSSHLLNQNTNGTMGYSQSGQDLDYSMEEKPSKGQKSQKTGRSTNTFLFDFCDTYSDKSKPESYCDLNQYNTQSNKSNKSLLALVSEIPDKQREQNVEDEDDDDSGNSINSEFLEDDEETEIRTMKGDYEGHEKIQRNLEVLNDISSTIDNTKRETLSVERDDLEKQYISPLGVTEAVNLFSTLRENQTTEKSKQDLIDNESLQDTEEKITDREKRAISTLVTNCREENPVFIRNLAQDPNIQEAQVKIPKMNHFRPNTNPEFLNELYEDKSQNKRFPSIFASIKESEREYMTQVRNS